MKSIIIIQARMGSTRLPGKVLKPLGNTVVLDYVVSRCLQVKSVDEVVVATSKLEQDDPIETWCKLNKISCFRGSERDVLDRYVRCAELYNPDVVVRVTADCPFIDYHLGEVMLGLMGQKNVDIIRLDGSLPRGLPMEVVSYRALLYMHHHGLKERHREHVTYYAYEYPNLFTSATISVPMEKRHPHLRITLDTKEDYQMLRVVADRFQNNKLISAQDVIDFLLEHPEVANINAHVKQKPVT